MVATALISVTELSIDIEPARWMYIRIAVRMAYTLGFHTNPSQWVESRRLIAEDAEIRSIAWWGYYISEKRATEGKKKRQQLIDGQLADISNELQNVMLQHSSIDTFVRHYSVGIHVDAQAIVRGMPTQKQLMRFACSMSRSIDPRRP
ncbi:Transcription factor, fungi [Penicillium camemberti]|uniref:Transcription factor, fungi n=1 Tax=Penicillium camemberti (strain FM 013) TaxID=1429867 RepID=A0A0G4PSY3_PENC3|nr:Transcription factor, fungi [Penicillium camemberti]